MTLSTRTRQLLNFAGSCLAFAGLGYVGIRVHDYWSDLSSLTLSSASWLGIISLSIVHGGANIFFVLAWGNLLRNFQTPLPILLTTKIFGISQLAKYIPGNVAHFAGRQALGMSHGVVAGPLAKSLVWELALLAVAAAQFGWIAMAAMTPQLSHHSGIALFCSSVILTTYACWRLFSPDVSRSFLYEVLFFVTSAFVFSGLASLVLEIEGLTLAHYLSIGGAYIVAWLIGFVTPGAPAGMGVREAVLLHLLAGLVPENGLLIIVLLARLASVIGDLLVFFVAVVAPAPSPGCGE